MIEIITKENYLKSTWRNGLGETSQIAIFPKESCFNNLDFDWRLSKAQIKGPNQFSKLKEF